MISPMRHLDRDLQGLRSAEAEAKKEDTQSGPTTKDGDVWWFWLTPMHCIERVRTGCEDAGNLLEAKNAVSHSLARSFARYSDAHRYSFVP